MTWVPLQPPPLQTCELARTSAPHCDFSQAFKMFLWPNGASRSLPPTFSLRRQVSVAAAWDAWWTGCVQGATPLRTIICTDASPIVDAKSASAAMQVRNGGLASQ